MPIAIASASALAWACSSVIMLAPRWSCVPASVFVHHNIGPVRGSSPAGAHTSSISRLRTRCCYSETHREGISGSSETHTALLPLSLEIETSGFLRAGGQILRLGFEIQNLTSATSPPCPPHSITHHSVCLQCRSVSRTD